MIQMPDGTFQSVYYTCDDPDMAHDFIDNLRWAITELDEEIVQYPNG